MKKTHSFIICILLSILSFGQTEVTLEDIWKNYKFYPKGVSGFKSMNDGKHYTTKSKDGDKIKINKHSFETGDVVQVLMNTDDKRLIDMGKYQFNQNEDKILISTNKGRVIRTAVKEIRIAGRNTQGVRIIKLTGDEKVVSSIKLDDNLV